MKKFLITNPKYTGEAAAVYDDAGLILSVDLSNTNMPPNFRKAFLSAVPAYSVDISQLQTNPDTIIVSEDVVITFDMFWEKYDEKFNKPRCQNLWERLNKSERALAFYKIANYEKLLKRKGQYKMHPDTWLRNKSFNDYITVK